jgi:zinc protease
MKKIPFLFIGMMLASFSAQAANVQEVTSPHGVTAWLIEDHKLPIIAMQFAFRGGTEQDPANKQGLSNLTMNLLTEGAGDYDAAAFQQKLADNSITLGFEAGRDSLSGTLKSLTQDDATAFDLLRLALTQPRFEKSEFDRLRNQQLAGLRGQLGNPGWQARYALFQQIYGQHPYGERRYGSTQTLAAITRSDIRDFAATHFARDNLVVAVAGDITPKQLGPLLDRAFAELPKHARLATIPEVVWPHDQAIVLVPREGTQTELLFALPAPKRDSPDWYATEIANYILGGGGFSSRLMQDVRDKKGLTYGINTGLSSMDHGAIIVGEAATDNARTGQAWDIASDTLRRFYQDGATDKEIEAAKDYLTGVMPLAMTSTDKIANVLLDIQLEHLGSDYLDRRNDNIRHVSDDDVQHAIQRWFNPDMLTLAMVGKPEGITPTQTRELTHN